MLSQPITCQRPWLLSSREMDAVVATGLLWPRRAIASSAITRGMPMASTKPIYTRTKAPPPFSPTT